MTIGPRTTSRSFRIVFLVWMAAILSMNAGAVTVEQWRADIETLRTQLPTRHPEPFHSRAQAEFDADLDQLSSSVPLLTDGQIVVGMQKAVAALRDGHTEIDMRSVIGGSYFPIRLEWMNDGLWVTKTTVDFVSICGARLVSVNGVDVDELHEILKTVISHDNDGWARVRSARYIPDAALLTHLGVLPEVGPARFVFETQHRVRIEIDLPAIPLRLLRNSLFAADPETSDTPLYRRDPDKLYWFVHLPEQKILYVKYNLCQQGSESFSSFSSRIFDVVDHNPIERFIVDIRNNVGGSNIVVHPLIEGLIARSSINRHDRLFVVIGPETFSSAVINAVEFKQWTNATLVGAPTGGNANHYGQVSSFVLPNSGVTVYHSTKKFELEPGETGGVQPHVPITTSSSDYFMNVDPIFESIVTLEPPETSTPTGRRRGVQRTVPRECPF